jgi:hypothetical protein
MDSIMKGFKPKSMTYFKREVGGAVVLGTLQTSKGETTFSNLSVVVVQEVYYLLQFNEDLPKERYWVGEGYLLSSSFMSERIDRHLAESISKGITSFKEEQHKSHLNPYSYLYGFVKGVTGIKLHELWSFEVF